MKISAITTTPLFVPYKNPFYWAHGQIDGAEVLLVKIETDMGVAGYGECISAPNAAGIKAFVDSAADLLLGRDPFHSRVLMREVYDALFRAHAVCNSPRFAGQVLAGLEMALWDLAGKACNRPAYDLFGGAAHREIQYFGFAMGKTPAEVASDARALADAGHDVIYIKAGFGADRDVETVRAVREAIGPAKRLRIDPNESWSLLQAKQMIRRLAPFDLEFIEQPTRGESPSAMTQLMANASVGISADQSVFTPEETFELVRRQAADLIVIGPHECGGLARLLDVATIAQAAGINICLHGVYETGITACAAHMAAAACPNLDDGNQHMLRFLEWDIIKSPDLALKNGRLPVLTGPGLGFEIDQDRVLEAAEAHKKRQSTKVSRA